ncbi:MULTISPECIES: hypothetical protein [unclassified Devosia]|jgi:hypothetical protein|uniref:hypothetical protein n=1 Tax=unclassified Devosia TaxID=196773 RepID=UPI00086A7FD8|nr:MULTISPECIES: hypothetical protein [unclassified Devosia]MBN9363459.1 hypothetical protein [Devosia sp.]ODS95043.1 MAG: hypothetical protein ABS47_04435 [Devosia sp. SCN 66-27]OJX25277.1 MAG: hypothetical protein BGO83_10460 [Devosia sp. 66-14]
MISSADAAAFLPPTFQILTGLSFAALLVIRFFAGRALSSLSGKLIAFSVIFIALGNFLMSQATAKSSLSGAAEFLTLAGASFFVGAIVVVIGLVVAARQSTAVVTK